MVTFSTDLRLLAFPSDLGWMAIALHDDVVQQLSFGRQSPRAAVRSLTISTDPVEKPTQLERRLMERLQAFAAGRRDEFLDVELDLTDLTQFQRRVIVNCRKVAYGRTLTYSELAARSGSPNAARAVGNVMRSNRFPLIVPCHRVVGSGGSLGGYSAPSGLKMKRRLLDQESLHYSYHSI